MITYKIHQIKDIANTDYAFRSYDPTKFDFADYECKYEGTVSVEAKTAIEICEDLFYEFNMNRPEDFTGHSLSTSDVIEIITDLTRNLYYCDWAGWTKVIM
jgi:hypothetical protein